MTKAEGILTELKTEKWTTQDPQTICKKINYFVPL